jgi:ribosomal protein S18 acetylase RimI-like enzyme
MTILVRSALGTDHSTIVEFNRLLALESEHKLLDPAILSAGVAAVLADPSRGRYFMAEQDGVLLGQLMLTTEWSDWRNGWFWWIQSAYVRGEARRMGVFRALYEHVAELARQDATVVGIRLYVEQENLRAQQTYERLGMERTGYLLLERCPL